MESKVKTHILVKKDELNYKDMVGYGAVFHKEWLKLWFCSVHVYCYAPHICQTKKNNKNLSSSPFCKTVMPQRATFMNLFNLKMTALRSRLSLFQCKHIVIVSGWWEYQLVGDISLGQHYILRIYEIKGLSKAILFLLVSKSWTSLFKSWIEIFLFFYNQWLR